MCASYNVETIWEELETFQDAEGDDDVVYCLLADGDTHVCHKHMCKHATTDSLGFVVCQLSGTVYGRDSSFSHNNDCNDSFASGQLFQQKEYGSRPWKFRRDNALASKSAFCIASDFGQETPKAWYPTKRCRKTPSSSSEALQKVAQCVDSVSRLDNDAMQTAPVVAKSRSLPSHMKDITNVVNTLLNTSSSGDEQARRECDVSLISQVAVARYVNRLKSDPLEKLCFTRLHEVLTAAERHAHDSRALDAGVAVKQNDSNNNTMKNRSVVRLVWMIHDALAHTETLPVADSVRSIASGILFALKRGISLDGEELVPAIPSVANRLPSIRKADVTAAARALQSCSHKGVSLVHKAVNSIKHMGDSDRRKVLLRFEDAAKLAKTL